jgi:hypothetical protein
MTIISYCRWARKSVANGQEIETMSMQKPPVPIADLDKLAPAAAIGGRAVDLTFTLSAYSSAPQ